MYIVKPITVIVLFIASASLAFAQNKYETADAYFQEAAGISKLPFDQDNDNLIKRSIVLYSKAISLNPKFSHAYRNRGRLYAGLHRLNEAIDDYSCAIKYSRVEDKPYLLINRGLCYYSINAYEAANNDYNAALVIDKNSSYVFFCKAQAELKLGRKQAAIENYRRAIKLDPQKAEENTWKAFAKELNIE